MNGGVLNVTAAAALHGSYGLQAVVNDATVAYVQDNSPSAEGRYRARFYFDPNSATMSNGHSQFLFVAYDESLTQNNDILRLRLNYQNGYRLRVEGRQDDGSLTYGTYQMISDEVHFIEFDWQAAANGKVDLWIDGQLKNTLYLTTGQRRVDSVRVGPQVNTAGVSGTLYFDAFESRRSSYIGPTASGSPVQVAALWLPLPSILDRIVKELGGLFSRAPAGQQPVILQAVPAGQTWRNYIYIGAQRVAVREYTATTASVYYLVGDHLGSTSAVTSSDGSLRSRLLYTAWGELRYTTGDTAIRYRFTGQREEVALGLYDYNARWYDPRLGRFVQADSIVAGAGNPLAWDRYAYTFNNPVRYNDPSGHNPQCGPDGIYCSSDFAQAFGITFEGGWSKRNRAIVQIAVVSVGYKVALELGLQNPAMAFSSVYKKGITFAWVASYKNPQGEIFTSGAITISSSRIEVASLSKPVGLRTPQMAATDARNNIVHELAHAFASLWYKNGNYDPLGPYGKSIPEKYLNNEGFYASPNAAPLTWNQHPCNASDFGCKNEVIADMFLGWIFDKFAENKVGEWRRNQMRIDMVEWVSTAKSR